MVPTAHADARHTALASEPRRRALAVLTESAVPLGVGAVAEALGLHITTARFHLEHLEAAGLVERQVARVGQRGRPQVLFSPAPAPLPVETAQQQLTQALAAVLGEDADGGRARSVRAGERWSAQYAAVADAAAAGAPAAGGPTSGAPAPGAPGPSAPVAGGPTSGAPASGAPASSVPAPGISAPGAGSATDLATPLLRVLTEIGFEPELRADQAQIALTACPFRAEARANPAVVCSVHLGLMQGLARSLGDDPDGIRLEPFVTPTVCLVHLPPTREL